MTMKDKCFRGGILHTNMYTYVCDVISSQLKSSLVEGLCGASHPGKEGNQPSCIQTHAGNNRHDQTQQIHFRNLVSGKADVQGCSGVNDVEKLDIN